MNKDTFNVEPVLHKILDVMHKSSNYPANDLWRTKTVLVACCFKPQRQVPL